MYVSANQQLLVASVGKESCCTVERVRGEPAWEIKRKWKDWLGYQCLSRRVSKLVSGL